MSRYYRMEVDVGSVSWQERGRAETTLHKAGMVVSGAVELRDGCSFYGHMSLAGGTTPHEKHEELKALFPDKKLASRWLDLDASEWDVVIEE